MPAHVTPPHAGVDSGGGGGGGGGGGMVMCQARVSHTGQT